MKIKTSAVLSAVMIAMLSGCGKGETDTKSDKTSSSESKATVSEISETVEEMSESIVESEEGSSQVPDELFTESVEDLYLSVDKKSIEIGAEDSEVIFVARDIIDPQTVQLMDADTGEVVGEMLDDAEFEKSGDDISGDCWYSLRYKLDDTFPTDPDVSEDKKYHFYARYIDGDTEHRSAVTEITVYESFTDKELNKMEEASNRIKDMMVTEEYKNLDTTGKKDKLVEFLRELEAEGLVDKDSIFANDENVTYSCCDIPSIIMLEPMPWERYGNSDHEQGIN